MVDRSINQFYNYLNIYLPLLLLLLFLTFLSIAMVQKYVLEIVASVNLLLALAALYACGSVIWRHILRQGINKKFVTMFYVMAILILGSIIGISLEIYLNLTKEDVQIDPNTNYGNNFGLLSISCVIHRVCYIGLVLLMISTIICITIGLKCSFYKNNLEMKESANNQLCCTYFLSITIFLATIAIEVMASLGTIQKVGVDFEIVLYYYVVLAPALAIAYIYSLYLLFRYMNTEENPALQPEHKKMTW